MNPAATGGGAVSQVEGRRGEESAGLAEGGSLEAREQFGRGMLLLGRGGSPAGAVECFRAALALDPSSSESAGYLAWARYLASPVKAEAAHAAIAELGRLASRDELFAARGHLLIAYIHEAERHLEAAAREVGVSLHLDPDLADAHAVWASLPEGLRPPLPAAPCTEAEVRLRRVSVKRLLLTMMLAVVGLGGFASTVAVLYRSSPSAPRITRIGAEDFMDIAYLMRIRIEGRRFKGMLKRESDVTTDELKGTLDALCRRLVEKGFKEGIFTDETWKLLGTCVGDEAELADGGAESRQGDDVTPRRVPAGPQ